MPSVLITKKVLQSWLPHLVRGTWYNICHSSHVNNVLLNSNWLPLQDIILKHCWVGESHFPVFFWSLPLLSHLPVHSCTFEWVHRKFGLVYGVQCHFQQYFIYIEAVSFIGEGNRSTRCDGMSLSKYIYIESFICIFHVFC